MANIFDKDNAALMSFGKVMSRMAAQPLDISEIWYDYDELETYAASDATAYAGQKVTYVDQDNNKVYQYSIQTDGTLKEIGVAPTGDETSITVSSEGLVAMFGFAGAETGSVPVKDAETGKLAWKTLEEIGAGDGNDDTTYEFTALKKIVGEGEDAVEEIYGITIQPKFNGQNQGDLISIAFDVYTKAEADAKFALKGEDAYDDTALAGRVSAIEADYLKAADKYDDTDLVNRVSANEEAIETLNGNSSVEGSVDKKVADAINEFATKLSDDDTINTYKELIDYAAEHGSEFTELVGEVDANTAAIETLNGTGVGSVDKKIADAITPLATTEALNEVKEIAEAAQTAEEVSIAIGTALEDYYTAEEVDAKGYAVATDVANAYATKEYIGTIPSDAEATNVIAYINEKAQEVLDSATGGSSESAASVKQQLDTYKAANDPKVSALLTEVWGSETYTGDSRLDAHDTAIAANTALAQKGVDDAATASQAVTDLASGQVTTNKNDIATLTTNFNNIVTAADTGLVAKVAALETVDTQIGARVTALETKDTSIEQTLGEYTNKISALESKDTDLAALIQGNTDKFANYYTKTEADAAVKAVTGEVVADTTLVAMIGAKADQATTYTKIEVDNLITGLGISDVNDAIQANTNAIAALAGEGNTSTVAKNAADIAALDATLKAAIENDGEGLDSIKELATWIETHGVEASAMSEAITALETKVDTGDQTVTAYVAAQIAANAYDLPAATAAILGGIKSAADVEVDGVATVVANAVYVNTSTNIGEVKAISTDILENGVEELILFGGNSGAAAE